ncbi:RNA polymerase subunit sigma [Rhodosalinus halophilus]|uniref:RNA polymerase subunit sigma n=1 Tax=Rhodosalinus halophilus TaxID=2259333 RepID=A0A365UAS8_9RHOB|nr:sigma-70 family RNA polymerase sigma factor [Rhodosalinus halophilus]RBI85241.1 RNA polymerase subunit sigma [Rhodosalinus halophilus]
MNKPFTPPRADRKLARPAEFLDAETELELARAWRERGDTAARNRLVTAHRALALAAARRAAGPGRMPDDDVIQQANIGLLKAAERFDPDKGFRFSTYAAWWIRAEIQDYRMRSWSLVRLGNSPALRRLFFNLRRVESRLRMTGEVAEVELDAAIAAELGVDEQQVAAMRQRLAARDGSLNRPAMGEEGSEIQELLEDPDADTETRVGESLDRRAFWKSVASHMQSLPEREREIVIASFVQEPPKTLAELGETYGISRERVRQLRERGLERLRKAFSTEAAAFQS